MSDNEACVPGCGHALAAHLISASTPIVRCPACPGGVCPHLATPPPVRHALRLIDEGRLREARRVVTRASCFLSRGGKDPRRSQLFEYLPPGR